MADIKEQTLSDKKFTGKEICNDEANLLNFDDVREAVKQLKDYIRVKHVSEDYRAEKELMNKIDEIFGSKLI